MRAAWVVFALLAAGCDRGAESGSLAGAASDERIECRVSDEWARDCAVEREGDVLTIRHADGGFRRLRILTDGRGLEAADGAEGAKVTIIDGQRIEVTVGAESYRLPAKIAGR
jgi:hypothetical protein